MCGVIVVDTGRSRSTNLGCDAYILIIALDIVVIIRSSINCPTVICLPTVCYFLREAASEIYGPRVYSLSYLLSDLLFATFIFRSILSKTQKYLAEFYLLLFASINLLQFYPVNLTISGTVTRKGLTTPLTRRVASSGYLCAGDV